VDIDLLTSNTMGAAKVRLVLHVLQVVQADKAFSQHPTVYTTLTYVLAKLRAQKAIKKPQWTQALYAVGAEDLVQCLQITFHALHSPGNERAFHSGPQSWVNLTNPKFPIDSAPACLALSEYEKRCAAHFQQANNEAQV
jgi:hypothetical protein